jgi:hypothetical protein
MRPAVDLHPDHNRPLYQPASQLRPDLYRPQRQYQEQPAADAYYFSTASEQPAASSDSYVAERSPATMFAHSSIGLNEVRMNFKPGNPDLSLASIKWLHDFGSYARTRAPGQQIEIRFSVIDPELQYRRLALVKQSLAARGITEDRLVIVESQRDANSFVLTILPLGQDSYTPGGITETVW